MPKTVRPLSNPSGNPVDNYVGLRVRTRRKAINMSQQELAKAIALTFQQVQKYERGLNRISASKLYEISVALGVPVAFFFDGYAPDGTIKVEDDDSSMEMLATPEGQKMATNFQKIRSKTLREKLADMVEALVNPKDKKDLS